VIGNRETGAALWRIPVSHQKDEWPAVDGHHCSTQAPGGLDMNHKTRLLQKLPSAYVYFLPRKWHDNHNGQRIDSHKSVKWCFTNRADSNFIIREIVSVFATLPNDRLAATLETKAKRCQHGRSHPYFIFFSSF
jgi:hypothetical protein